MDFVGDKSLVGLLTLVLKTLVRLLTRIMFGGFARECRGRATKIRCLKPVIGRRPTGLSETRLNGVEPRADLHQPVGGLPVKTAGSFIAPNQTRRTL